MEADLILFFKLYLLRHHANYIDYMADTKILARWFYLIDPTLIDTHRPASIVCGSCYSILGESPGGAITFSCGHCHGNSNMGYEIQQLCTILEVDWRTCVYGFCKAIEDIHKTNNVAVMEHILSRT